jgi:tetratricopeptide (TPR) repeat protein
VSLDSATVTGRNAVVLAALLLASCRNSDTASLTKPIERAKFKAPPPDVPPPQWRAELRDAYRLRPDARLLLAFGEIDRLAGKLPAPPGKPAAATFENGRWQVRSADAPAGDLPELPDFPDYLALLVVHARSRLPAAGVAPRADSSAPEPFLMPGLEDSLRSSERSLAEGDYVPAARALARLAFQLPDRMDLAPVIPARALALLAAARSRDPNACAEEEVLLAHALGYSKHAEALAAKLPPSSPIRAFEAADGTALVDLASATGASQEARFLAIKRSTRRGDLTIWREARARFMRGDDSIAVIGTGLDIDLPKQVEVSALKEVLIDALPRAVIRDLSKGAKPPEGFEAVSELQTKLKGAVDSARGSLWDEPVVRAYYEAAYYSPLGEDRWPPWAGTGTGTRLMRLAMPESPIAPKPDGDTRGVALLLKGLHRRYQYAPPQTVDAQKEIRAIVPWIDARPAHRSELASFMRWQILDPGASEELYRSLDAVLGDGNPSRKAEAAIYIGDTATVRRLLASPDLTAPEATSILWSWQLAKGEPEALDVEFQRAIARFPHDWDTVNYYLDVLRKRKDYRKGGEVVEQWLARNPDRRTPGRFHAHVRLSHNYVLTHEYAKGLHLLESMTESEPFQKAVIQRGTAECLAGLGRLDEAEKMSRQAAAWMRGDTETRRDLIRILWMRDKNDEAAAMLADEKGAMPEWAVCASLREDLPAAFPPGATQRLDAALDAIVKRPVLTKYPTCLYEGFGDAGRWEDAIRVAEKTGKPNEHLEVLIQLYGYMRAAKGRDAAAEWLKQRIPEGKRNPLSMKAFYTKNDDLLWDVIGTPSPEDHPEWVWLFRALAFALREPDDGPHRAPLVAHYGKAADDPYDVMGRYLVGLATEADMFAVVARHPGRSEVAYYLGARAQRERRFRDACEWYRVASEASEATSPRNLALRQLNEWSELGQGLWRLEAAK